MSEQENDTPNTLNEEIEEVNPTEQEVFETLNAATESLVVLTEMCSDAREFSAVARHAIKNEQPEMAVAILTCLIERLDVLLLREYSGQEDYDLVELVQEKMSQPNPYIENIKSISEEDDG